MDVGTGSDHVTLPKYARGFRLPWPERVEDPRPGPAELAEEGEVHLLDEWSGEEVRLFAGREPMGGYPIVVKKDRRRRGRSHRKDGE